MEDPFNKPPTNRSLKDTKRSREMLEGIPQDQNPRIDPRETYAQFYFQADRQRTSIALHVTILAT